MFWGEILYVEFYLTMTESILICWCRNLRRFNATFGLDEITKIQFLDFLILQVEVYFVELGLSFV